MRANATPLSLQVISIKPIAPGNIEVSAEQARVANHISEKPLVVLTAGRPIDAARERHSPRTIRGLMGRPGSMTCNFV